MINYVICAAGEGSRFKADLEGIPKPAIMLNGKSLLEWSLDSLPIFNDDKIIIITQSKHRLKEKLFYEINKKYPFNDVEWLELSYLTTGQLETAVLAEMYLDSSGSICIYNSDSYFKSKGLLSSILNKDNDGVIPCAEVEGSSWSFCKTDGKNRIIEVKEKKRISNWASIGFYYFKDTYKFLDRAKQHLSKDLSGDEYYVAPLYDEYIKKGETIALDPITEFYPMGTPSQIEDFWNISMSVIKQQNLKSCLVVDLDNTITIEDPSIAYPNKKPNLKIIKKLQEYSRNGHEIIIQTARRMGTHKDNESKVIADIGKITLEWLDRHSVPFNGIKFGKPFARNGFYIDDKAVRPSEFLKYSNEELLAICKRDEA